MLRASSGLVAAAFLLSSAAPAAADPTPPGPLPLPPPALAAPPVAAAPPLDLGPGAQRPIYPSYFILPAPEFEIRPPPYRSWYGWQTLIVFGAGLGFSIGIGASGSNSAPYASMAVGGGMMMLGAPIIHFAHGNVRKGLGVLGMYAGATALNLGLAATIFCGAGGGCRSADSSGTAAFVVVGSVVGLLTATIVDVSALDYKDDPKATHRDPEAAQRFHVLPTFQHTSERTTFGLVGSF